MACVSIKPEEARIIRVDRRHGVDVETMHEEYFPKIYNFIYYRLLNKEATEDVVSEVFEKIVKSYHSFNPEKASFSTWAFTIARNTLISYYRKRRVESDIDDVAESRFSIEDEYEALDDTAAHVRRLLSYLTEEEREIIFLKYSEEMKNTDIAAALNMNVSTVSTKVSRALAKMRAHEDEK